MYYNINESIALEIPNGNGRSYPRTIEERNGFLQTFVRSWKVLINRSRSFLLI